MPHHVSALRGVLAWGLVRVMKCPTAVLHPWSRLRKKGVTHAELVHDEFRAAGAYMTTIKQTTTTTTAAQAHGKGTVRKIQATFGYTRRANVNKLRHTLKRNDAKHQQQCVAIQEINDNEADARTVALE